MSVSDLLSKARETMSAGRVFGEPIHSDGVTVIPVSRLSGGGGAGGGEQPAGGENGQPEGRSSNSGGGFGLGVAPAGVFVIKDGNVSWQPAVDVNRIVVGAQIVAAVGLLVLRSWLRARAAHK
ncbi:Sporulation protein YtfJ (Spore_YtfJ) [Pseudonocardia thermophila]|uniref:Sporulation protein YtfJ (Spore_YtfJ) n=1 Tax=Pseudonocardia thermophila TaxID=1848 RepID=A0A1M6XMZ3_PSETH|nr:spore germination protein GerW family protein [Pseudonocardia thermophila]SHL07165.1 Sporulation protein YtfJ (Spore_YtfJ) [Pseudonocardia thermophila]